MNTSLTNEILNTIKEHKHKIPSVLLLFAFFSSLFSKQAKLAISSIKFLLEQVLPTRFIFYLQKIHITQEQFIFIWVALLLLILLCSLWNVIKFFILNPYNTDLVLDGEILFFINSIILPSVIIYNSISNTPIRILEIYPKHLSNILTLTLIVISYLLSTLYFLGVYLSPLIFIFQRIKLSNMKIRYKLILYLIVLVIINNVGVALTEPLFLIK